MTVSSRNYVLIWREPPSQRLRTYVQDGTDRPLASPLRNIAPIPSLLLHSAQELEGFLATPADPRVTAALDAKVARAQLGWDPISTDTIDS